VPIVSLLTEKKVHILLVEDERSLSHLIERKLIRAGYNVSLAFDGVEATAAAFGKEIDLIILDINLPKKTGFEVLKELRGDGYATPVLILSARGDIDDRILGLELGADDYLVKPFDSAELLLRIQAILRRSGHARTSVLQAADLTMDVVKREVVRGAQQIDLTQKEFSLLEFLLRNKNKILTRKRIAEEVWGYTFDTGTNIVDVYLSYLRDSIDKGFDRKLIQTIRGEGFLLKDD
jgi:DNA-binding response OmpR family regulator